MKPSSLMTRSTAILLATCIGSVSLPLWAQNAPASQAPTAASSSHSHPAHMMERRKAGQERRLKELKSKLQLSAEQESAWSAFAAAMALPAEPIQARPDFEQLARLSTPERLDRMKALREQRQAQINARMDQRAQAARSFYDSLQAPQKKIFDEETGRLLAQRARHRHHGHG